MNVIDALNKIHNRKLDGQHGADILTESALVLNYLSDMIPHDDKTRRRIKTAYESGAIKIMIKQNTTPQLAFQQAKVRLHEYAEVSLDVADETIAYFYRALNWELPVASINNSNNNQMSNVTANTNNEKQLHQQMVNALNQKTVAQGSQPPPANPSTSKQTFYAPQTQVPFVAPTILTRKIAETMRGPKVVVPSGYITIEKIAFYERRDIFEIELPDTIQVIEEQVFQTCAFLKAINIPNQVTKISDSCFSQCEALERIELPSSIETIGRRAFENCSSLQFVSVPETMIKISEYAFSHCSSLEKFLTKSNSGVDDYCGGAPLSPNSNTELGQNAFVGCFNLKLIVIPHGISTIQHSLAYDSALLQDVYIPNSVVYIESSAFGGKASAALYHIRDGSFAHREVFNTNNWGHHLKYTLEYKPIIVAKTNSGDAFARFIDFPNKYLEIVQADKSIDVVEVLIAFELIDIKREYLVYTKNEVDGGGNVTLYCSSMVRQNGTITSIGDIEIQDEIRRIQNVVGFLSN